MSRPRSNVDADNRRRRSRAERDSNPRARRRRRYSDAGSVVLADMPEVGDALADDHFPVTDLRDAIDDVAADDEEYSDGGETASDDEEYSDVPPRDSEASGAEHGAAAHHSGHLVTELLVGIACDGHSELRFFSKSLERGFVRDLETAMHNLRREDPYVLPSTIPDDMQLRHVFLKPNDGYQIYREGGVPPPSHSREPRPQDDHLRPHYATPEELQNLACVLVFTNADGYRYASRRGHDEQKGMFPVPETVPCGLILVNSDRSCSYATGGNGAPDNAMRYFVGRAKVPELGKHHMFGSQSFKASGHLFVDGGVLPDDRKRETIVFPVCPRQNTFSSVYACSLDHYQFHGDDADVLRGIDFVHALFRQGHRNCEVFESLAYAFVEHYQPEPEP